MDTSQWGLLTYLLIFWGALTLVLFLLWLWRSHLENQEDDQLFLEKGEEKMAQDQAQLVARINKLGKPIVFLGITSCALLLVIAGVWVWRGLQTFR